MAVKKRPSNRRASSPARESAPEAALLARDVVLERVESQMQMVLEAVISTRESLTAQMTALEVRVCDRIGVLERAVRQNSDDIKKNSDDIKKNSDDIKKNSDDIKKNSDDIKDVREEVARLRHDFDRRAELARVDSLEQRVARMEAKLGIAS